MNKKYLERVFDKISYNPELTAKWLVNLYVADLTEAITECFKDWIYPEALTGTLNGLINVCVHRLIPLVKPGNFQECVKYLEDMVNSI